MHGQLVRYGDTQGDLDLSCDAVVIGSGAGGAAAATELAEGGLDVILLEEGGVVRTEDFSADTTEMLTSLCRDGGTTVIFGRSPITYLEGRCVGGTTVLNGGMCWRTPERVLKRWQLEHGLHDLSPERLAPIFQHVEEVIQAREQDEGSEGRNNLLFKAGCDRLGYRTVRNRRTQVHCVGASDCVTGCPTGAKRSTALSYVPRFLGQGGTLFTECKVERLQIDGGRITGVQGTLQNPETDKYDRRFSVHAKIVAVAGGAIQTPLLLLKNRIHDPHKQIGRNFTIHPNLKMLALFDEEVNPYQGTHQAWQCWEFEQEGIVMATGGVAPAMALIGYDAWGREHAEFAKDYRFLAAGGVLVDDYASGRVRWGPFGIPIVRYDITHVDQGKFLRAVALLSEVYFAAGAKKIFLPFHRFPPLESVDDIRRLYEHPPKVKDTEYFTAHLMGTCRMSADPARGVVSPSGETYAVKGLFLTDASALPTTVGVNPQETIMGLSTYICRGIVENRRKYLGERASGARNAGSRAA